MISHVLTLQSKSSKCIFSFVIYPPSLYSIQYISLGTCILFYFFYNRVKLWVVLIYIIVLSCQNIVQCYFSRCYFLDSFYVFLDANFGCKFVRLCYYCIEIICFYFGDVSAFLAFLIDDRHCLIFQLIECPSLYELMASLDFSWEHVPLLQFWKENIDVDGNSSVLLESYPPVEAVSVITQALSINKVYYLFCMEGFFRKEDDIE